MILLLASNIKHQKLVDFLHQWPILGFRHQCLFLDLDTRVWFLTQVFDFSIYPR